MQIQIRCYIQEQPDQNLHYFFFDHNILHSYQAFRVEYVIRNHFSYFITKTFVVGTQKTFSMKRFFWPPKTNVKTDG